MDTPVPDDNLSAMGAVDIVETPLSRDRRVMNADHLQGRRRCYPLRSPAIVFAISLDIVTERPSVAPIAVHDWLLSVTESSVTLPPCEERNYVYRSRSAQSHITDQTDARSRAAQRGGSRVSGR